MPLEVKNLSEEDAGDLAGGRCGVCNESFEKFWDKEAEEFMIKDAVIVDGKVDTKVSIGEQSRHERLKPRCLFSPFLSFSILVVKPHKRTLKSLLQTMERPHPV